ncbi:MAG TPA: trehalose-phosphatase [Burkholderiales bacterium]|nr:trehalose-phosphatase [Burkholderiales bacterium]
MTGIARPETGASTELGRLPPPAASAFFLDVDGTLLAIATTPASVAVDPGLPRLLARLQAAVGGALALISGRAIAALDRLFPPLRLPAAGQHGAERRDSAGRHHVHAMDPRGLAEAREIARAFEASHAGVLTEDKGQSLAVHFRQAPEAEAALRARLESVVAASDGELALQPGKMVFEVKPAGRDKGTAIGEFMAEPPFRGRFPVFIGDDITDEYGFAVVNGLGGLSVKVGPGASCARYRLTGVVEVRDWLEAYLGGSEARSA